MNSRFVKLRNDFNEVLTFKVMNSKQNRSILNYLSDR